MHVRQGILEPGRLTLAQSGTPVVSGMAGERGRGLWSSMQGPMVLCPMHGCFCHRRSAPAIWPCPRQVGWPVSKLLQLQSFKEHPRGKGEITNLTGQFGVNVESQSNKSPADCSGEGRLRGWAGCEPTEHRGSQGSSRALQTSAMPSIKGDARGQSNVGWRLSKAGKGQIGKGVPSSWVQEEETTSRQQKQRGAQE